MSKNSEQGDQVDGDAPPSPRFPLERAKGDLDQPTSAELNDSYSVPDFTVAYQGGKAPPGYFGSDGLPNPINPNQYEWIGGDMARPGGDNMQNKGRESLPESQSPWDAKPAPLPRPPGHLRVLNNPSGSGVDLTPLSYKFGNGAKKPVDRYDPKKPYPLGELNSYDLRIFRKNPYNPDQRPYQKKGPDDPLEFDKHLTALEAELADRGLPQYPDSDSTVADSPDSWGPHEDIYRYYGRDNPMRYSDPPQIFAENADPSKGFVPYPTTGRDPRRHPYVDKTRNGLPPVPARGPKKIEPRPPIPGPLEHAPAAVQEQFLMLVEQRAEKEIAKVRQEMEIIRVQREQEHRLTLERMNKERKDLAKKLSERQHAQYEFAMIRAEKDRKGLIDQLASKYTEKDGNNREVARLIQAELALKAKLELWETERNEALQKNEDQQIKIRELNIQLGETRVNLNRQTERTNHAQERVVELLKERGERDTKIARLEKQRQGNDAKGQDAEIRSTRDENEKLQRKLTALEKKSTNEAYQLASLRQAVDATAQNEIEMQAAIKDWEVRCEKFHDTTTGLQDDLAAVRNQKATLVDEKKRYVAGIKTSKEKIVSLEHKVKTLEEEALDFREQTKSFEERVKELDAQIKGLEESTDSFEHIKALQEKINTLEATISPLKTENKAFAREIETHKETIKTMEVNEEVLQASIQSDETQIKTLEKKIKSMEREAKDLTHNNADELKSLQETLKLFKEENESANAQVAILEEQLDLYQKQEPNRIGALMEQLEVAVNARRHAEEQWEINYDELEIAIQKNKELQRAIEDANKAAALVKIRKGTLKRHADIDIKSENTDLEERAFVQLEPKPDLSVSSLPAETTKIPLRQIHSALRPASSPVYFGNQPVRPRAHTDFTVPNSENLYLARSPVDRVKSFFSARIPWTPMRGVEEMPRFSASNPAPSDPSLSSSADALGIGKKTPAKNTSSQAPIPASASSEGTSDTRAGAEDVKDIPPTITVSVSDKGTQTTVESNGNNGVSSTSPPSDSFTSTSSPHTHNQTIPSPHPLYHHCSSPLTKVHTCIPCTHCHQLCCSASSHPSFPRYILHTHFPILGLGLLYLLAFLVIVLAVLKSHAAGVERRQWAAANEISRRMLWAMREGKGGWGFGLGLGLGRGWLDEFGGRGGLFG